MKDQAAAEVPLARGSQPVQLALAARAARERSSACCIFLGFFALYMLSIVDHMLLQFTDSLSMLEAANRLLDHGIGDGEGMHEKWCLGQLLIDLMAVGLRRMFDPASPVQQFVLVRLQSALPASIGAAVPTCVFLIGTRLGFNRLTSLLAALCVGLGTMTWVYSQVLFAESTLALLWLVVIYAMLAFSDTGLRRWLTLAGIAAGYALITKATTAAVLPVLPVWAALVLRDRTRNTALSWRSLVAAAAALLIPLLAFGLLNLWYNYARFGSVLDSGYRGERDGASGGFTTPLLVGVFGLALSTGKGFFFYNPIALLGLFGIRQFLRRHRMLGCALLAIVIVTALVHSRWWAWHGDFAWGPRFMVPLTPLFALFALSPIARALNRVSAWRPLRLLLIAAMLQLSVGVQLLGIAFDPGRFIDVVSDKCEILRGGSYFRERKFPLLDDGFILHFVPHFNPITGHLWMLRASLASDEEARIAILKEPPWFGLNPLWVPRRPERIDTSIGVWWLHPDNATDERRGPARTLLISLCLLLSGAAIEAARRLRPRAVAAKSGYSTA